MAQLGRWTGGVQSQGNPPEAWAAPANMFDAEVRNDGAVYAFDFATSTLTLPSTGLADGYLLVGRYEYEDTSNGRLNPQGKIVQTAGTGTFVGGASGGYNRDNSEDRSYVSCWAFTGSPSAISQYQLQWKADADDSTGGTVRSCFDVIPLYYADFGAYTSTSAAMYGGTTPNQVTGFAGTDGTNITIAGDVVTLSGDNKRYLALGSQFFEGRGGRTQRWHGFRVDGAKVDSAKAYSYYRNGSNDESGEIFTHLIATQTTDVTLDQFCYRGDGVGAGQGGADADGSTPGVGDHAIVVLELHDSAEVFHSFDSVGGVDLNVTGPVDQSLCRATDISFNDAPSWTRASDIAMNAVVSMDALFGANISAAQEVVGTTSRWTAQARLTINGAEQNELFGGDYARNNQGTIDTFGWSANLLGFAGLTAGQSVGISVQELAGGEDGGQYSVQPGWSGFWGINLDSLEPQSSIALSPQSMSQAQSVDNSSILQAHAIAPDEINQLHTMADGSLVTANTITPQSIAQSQSLPIAALSVAAGAVQILPASQLFVIRKKLKPNRFRLLRTVDIHLFAAPVVGLSPQSMTQAQSISLGSIIESAAMSPEEMLQVHTVDNAVVMSANVLNPEELAHLVVLGVPGLTQAHMLSVQSVDQAQFADNAGLFQGHALSPEDVNQQATLALATIIQASVLATVSAQQQQSIADGVLSTAHSISPDSLTQPTTLDLSSLLAASVIGPQDITQALSLANSSLAQSGSLSTTDILQLQSLLDAVISEAASLTIDELTQIQNTANSALAQSGSISPEDLSQLLAIDVTDLSQSSVLAALGLLQPVSINDGALSVTGNVAPLNLLQPQIVENVPIFQRSVVQPEDLVQLQSLSDTGLGLALSAQSTAQQQSLDVVDLTQINILAVASLSHLQAIDSPLLSQAQILAVDDLVMQQLISASSVYLPTSEIFLDSTLIVEQEGRVLLLTPESRTEIVKDV